MQQDLALGRINLRSIILRLAQNADHDDAATSASLYRGRTRPSTGKGGPSGPLADRGEGRFSLALPGLSIQPPPSTGKVRIKFRVCRHP